jgi:hypothetical protein
MPPVGSRRDGADLAANPSGPAGRRLKVAKEVKPGEEFEYVFDLGDNWRHRCNVEPEKGDPIEEYGIVPNVPAPIWGWGSIPDQYGRQAFDHEVEDDKLDDELN